MKLPLNGIKRIMKDSMKNKKIPVSTKGVFLLTQKVESFIVKITQQAEDRLIKENELRKFQGLKPKKRISEAMFSEVLNT